MSEQDLPATLTFLAKRRGIFYQSSEIYGGLRSAYDYGPLGVELKRNLAQEWWRAVVAKREDVVGIDRIPPPAAVVGEGNLYGLEEKRRGDTLRSSSTE